MKTEQGQIPTFAIATLGCKVNQADSEAISEQFATAGYQRRNWTQTADVYVVNTCTVTHQGDRSSRQIISQVRRSHPEALLVVTGCYAEVAPQVVAALPGVDLVIGNHKKNNLVDLVQTRLRDEPQAGRASSVPEREPLPLLTDEVNFSLSVLSQREAVAESDNADRPGMDAGALFQSRTRVQLKAQDGCDNRCTYCIVPLARGKSRSRSRAAIREMVERKVAAGFQEVVLTGVHLGDYNDEGHDLGDLIADLLAKTALPRLRVSSLEPEDFRLEWLALWSDPRLCRHLHLPLQSGADSVLRRMGRRYTVARYREIITAARTAIPGLALSTDLIVGFPGETGEEFEQSYATYAEFSFARGHIFRFSPRQGTVAARLPRQVPDRAKRERSELMLTLAHEKSVSFREQFVGDQVTVLWEHPRSGSAVWEGLTDNYLRVELPQQSGDGDLTGTLSTVLLTGLQSDGMQGIRL